MSCGHLELANSLLKASRLVVSNWVRPTPMDGLAPRVTFTRLGLLTIVFEFQLANKDHQPVPLWILNTLLINFLRRLSTSVIEVTEAWQTEIHILINICKRLDRPELLVSEKSRLPDGEGEWYNFIVAEMYKRFAPHDQNT